MIFKKNELKFAVGRKKNPKFKVSLKVVVNGGKLEIIERILFLLTQKFGSWSKDARQDTGNRKKLCCII